MNSRLRAFRVPTVLCLFLAGVWGSSARAQVEKGAGCQETITANDGFKIRSVKVKARYLPDLAIPLPSSGTNYSPDLLLPILESVHQAMRKEANREGQEGETEHRLLKTVTVGKGKAEETSRSGKAISLKFVSSCTKVIDASECKSVLGEANSKCVDVIVHAFSLRVDTANPVSNLLNIPRSNQPSFLSQVPGPLLALNPKLGFNRDRKFGSSATFEISANLLDLSKNFARKPLKEKRSRLDLELKGEPSLDGSYYKMSSKISFSRSISKNIDRLAIEAGFTADRDPLSLSQYLRNAATIGGAIKLRTDLELFSDVALSARYRRSSNRFTSRTALPSEFTNENAFEGTALLDGRLWKGVSRLAVYLDANSPNKSRDSYYRVAAIWGYQKEFLVKHNQSVGVEALVGGGRAWGTVPQYAGFFGGNSAKNFLYEAKESSVVTSFPVGPLLRSFGSGQATVSNGLARIGGTSYWNLSLNVSVPVPKWSSPLVPDITIEIPTGVAADQNPIMEDRPLRVILKNQGESSRKVLERLFVKEGLSQPEAQAKSRREVKSINSILGFIADEANIYSVKPLLMFDAARLNAPGTTNNKTRFAFGAGVQVTVVIAKFEAGYMRTLNPLPGDGEGNFVTRLFFQNLF